MSNKQFSERLNKELDDIGVPKPTTARIEVFSKLLKIPRFKAEALLNGQITPEAPLLKLLADELEVQEDWLLGRDNRPSF